MRLTPSPSRKSISSLLDAAQYRRRTRGRSLAVFKTLTPRSKAIEGATRWWPPVLSFIHQARDQRTGQSIFPWVDTEKPFFWEAPVVMALSPSDSVELIPNHITEYGLEAMEGAGRPFLPKYHNRELWMDDVLGLYYHYLNLGIHLSPTAGSASGVLPNPIGFNRVYANFPGPFSRGEMVYGRREGHSFVTNGPMLFFHVKPEGTMMKATVEAHARRAPGSNRNCGEWRSGGVVSRSCGRP